MTIAPLPPGRGGLPLLGETLAFAKNPFRFLDERLAAHGRIFRTNVLGRKTVVIASPEAAGRFIDGSVVMREGSMPPHVQELFGGRSLPLLDGDVHAARKNVVLQAFTREAMAAYLPINLPGTPYRKALKARDRILAVLRRIVRERRAAPADDGLSRILAAAANVS